ncbi:MAG: hypothetical protein AMK69_24460 [Nitrospira bacterium SG8_3]|nr:MAG: hypothetical protein AMK69_24460 [Nitrospira bacterium SG8_3]
MTKPWHLWVILKASRRANWALTSNTTLRVLSQKIDLQDMPLGFMLDRVKKTGKDSHFHLSDTELKPLIAFKKILRQNRRQASLGGWLQRLRPLEKMS